MPGPGGMRGLSDILVAREESAGIYDEGLDGSGGLNGFDGCRLRGESHDFPDGCGEEPPPEDARM